MQLDQQVYLDKNKTEGLKITMTLEQLERKFTEHYRSKMREYAKVEALHSDYGGTENTKRMHMLWGECIALKSVIEIIKEIRLDNKLPLEGSQ